MNVTSLNKDVKINRTHVCEMADIVTVKNMNNNHNIDNNIADCLSL